MEAALRLAERDGWAVEQTQAGHRWGVVRCADGCEVSIWSTSRNPGNHAKAIRKAVDRCPHRHTKES